MKMECGIIRDLLPLYADDICSPESRAAIEQHLMECSSCREKYQSAVALLPEQSCPEPDTVKEGNNFRHGLRKIRRRWIFSLCAVLLAVPLLLMSIAQANGEGICFSNIGQILTSYRFLSLLENGNYSKAFSMLELDRKWDELTDYESWLSGGVKPEDYQEITIDGELWMIAPSQRSSYFSELPDSLEGENALEFWYTICQNTQAGHSLYLIPADVYEKLNSAGRPGIAPAAEETGETELRQPFYVRDKDGQLYCIGLFSGVGNEIDEDEKEDYLYSHSYEFACIPKSVWTHMMEESALQKAAFEERAAQYLSLGYDEWLDISRKQFIAGMEKWEAEYGRITRSKFRTAYYNGVNTGFFGTWSAAWLIEFNLQFSGSEKSGDGICFSVNDGKILLSGGYYRSQNSIVDRFLTVFSEIDCYVIPDGEG